MLLRRLFLSLFTVMLLLIAGGAFYLHTAHFRHYAVQSVSRHIGRELSLAGEMDIILRNPIRIVLHDVHLKNSNWAEEPEMFTAERIEFSLRLLPLFLLNIEIPELKVDRPRLFLERNAEKQTNWQFTQNPSAIAMKLAAPEERGEIPLIGNLIIKDGLVTYKDAVKDVLTTVKVATITGTENENDSLTISGAGTFQKQPFTLDFRGASMLQLRDTSSPYPFRLKTAIGTTRAELQGTVEDPVQMEGVYINLRLTGKDAADLFPITGISLPPTPPYDVKGLLTKEGDHWNFRQFAGTMGDSDLNGDIFWYPKRERPFFSGEFISENLDMKDLAGFIGAHEKPKDKHRVIPDRPLDISRLAAMNAEVSFKGTHVKTPEILENFFMKVMLKDKVLELHPIRFRVAKGSIEGNVMIDGRQNPPFTKADISFNHLSLSDLFAPLAKKFGEKNVTAGKIGGRAELEGKGASLHEMLAASDGEIGIAMEGGYLSRLLLELVGLDIMKSLSLLVSGDRPVPIGCILGDFEVNAGKMDARTMLIDTEVSMLSGKGTVDLQNERVDMRFHVHPKDPTLLSARAPLHVQGTLKKPELRIDKAALLLRGGIAAALGLVAPPAALLAFIEPGLGNESSCVGWIRGMESKE